MAYTFVVEDGTGLTTANSYVSVSEANDYLIQNNYIYPTWDNLDNGDKQKLLSWASRYLDQKARWNGEKTVEDSGLRWPRTGVEDVDGNPIEEDEIPYQLRQATIEMTRYLMDGDRSADRGQDGLKEVQVDVIKLVFDTSYRLPEVPNEINNILRGLGVIISGPNSFAKIRRA
jgi:hypothetical protein